MKISRRNFLRTSAGGGALVLGAEMANTAEHSLADNHLCVFNKPLQHMDYAAQAELIAEIGFDGVEATVRKGGHVEPERVEEDLPKQIEALKKSGIQMAMMTTDITNAESELHQRVMKTAADLGVKMFRMGGIKLAVDRSIPEQIDEIRGTMKRLVEFCEPLGLQPLVQNHAGAARFGAGIWDVHSVMEGIDPKQAGVAFDIRHATVEGGTSWPTEFQLIRPRIGVVYCKDFIWGKAGERPKNVPLGSGRVDYRKFIGLLKRSEYRGPICVAMEYTDHRDRKLLQASIEAIRHDRKVLVDWLKEFG
jgi:sugar phosphate isomerase/epimerase